MCQRPGLTPAGEAAVNKLGVACAADLGAETQRLGHAKLKALDQDVGVLNQLQHRLDAPRVFHVDRDLRCNTTTDNVDALSEGPLAPAEAQHPSKVRSSRSANDARCTLI